MFEQTQRTRRVSESIRRELSQPLLEICRDQKLGLVTVTVVDVSPDLRHAKVYITALGADDAASKAVDVLNNEAGPLRHHLAQEIPTRNIPRLTFVYDASVERGANLSRLIDSLVPDDSDEETGDSDNP